VPAEPSRQATIDIACPGFVGAMTAVNADGIMVIEHDTKGLHTSASGGWVARSIVLLNAIEIVRAPDTADQIGRLFMDRPVRLGSNTHVVMPSYRHPDNHSFIIEWDGNRLGNGVTVRHEDPSVVRDAIVCTNHYLERRPEDPVAMRLSYERMRILIDFLKSCRSSKNGVDVEKTVKMMDSVARSDETITYLTVIALPDEKKLFFAVTPHEGVPATRGKWIELLWSQVFQAS
jgi:hypothetical protein